LLAQDRSVRSFFEKLNYSIRKYFSDLITDVKSGEARVRRAEQIAELLLATMEAERELPPILQAAFLRNERAREGWRLMTPIKRRGHLMGIFYCKSPDSRAKRVAKAVQEAANIAEKKTSAALRRKN
jgi:uncharacterized protein YdeI (YjbR/CyaY-like superfamily)